jgi:ubiquinone/menaquinone biosynthesis C-methylase UbiE
MDNSFPGGRLRPVERNDIARLDFAEGARGFVSGALYPVVIRQNRSRLDQAFAKPATAPKNLAEIQDVIAAAPITPAGHRMSRSVQEMIWKTTYATVKKQEAALLAELDHADKMGPGNVEYDPDFRFPDYFDNSEFHLQQGGYADPLGGYVYHLGGNVFHSGKNERAQANKTLVDSLPTPADGRVGRILELACAVGGSSVPLKERFPHAEVWATDISAGMVRYGHKRAVDLGVEIHFKQMASENITFPDDHFDIVYANILFHELPTEAARQTVAEAYRVLRPGGVVAFADIKDQAQVEPGTERALAEYTNAWQVANNNEPYFTEFFHNDLADMLREAGFRNVNSDYRSNAGVWAPTLSLPVRVGEK